MSKSTKEKLSDIINHYLPYIEEDYYWISPEYDKSFLLRLCILLSPMNKMVSQKEKDKAFEIIKLLLEYGVDPNEPGSEYTSQISPYKKSYQLGEVGKKLREEFLRFGFEEK